MQLGHGETIADTARVLSRYVDLIMIRTFEEATLLEMAEYASVPVINGLSDETHPCQAMADILTIKERFGKLDGLRIAYVGDGNNVAASLLYAAAQFNIDFSIATPEGYELPEAVRKTAAPLIAKHGIDVMMTTHPEQAVANADVIYTDTWVSMGQEAESAERRKTFDAYRVNQDLLNQASSDAIVLHCLPAHRGDEITDDVADGAQSAIFQQAHNRLHAQKAILVHLMGNPG
ncbi:MAG: ornithine carbamoyltransferase, partial [Aggregatilineales bacterium]